MTAYIVDVETCSLYGEVIELAYAPMYGTCGVGETSSERFKPSGKWDARAVAINRISPEKVTDCRKSSEATVPPADYWIGHNIIYDWERLGRPRGVKLICTLRLSELLWPKLDTYRLSSLYLQLFGIDSETVSHLEGLHGAATDVRLTGKVFGEIVRQSGVNRLEEFPCLSHPSDWSNQ